MSMLARLLQRGDGDQLVVAPMRRRDIAEIMPIENASYPRPWTEGVFRSEIDQAKAGTRCYLTARRRGMLLGYAGLMFAIDDGHVTNIAVAPAEQRRGVGRRLLAELAWRAIAEGCTAMTLEVRHTNTAAQAMYARLGFESVGVRQRYYENTDDAIVMWLQELQSAEFAARLRAFCPEAAR